MAEATLTTPKLLSLKEASRWASNLLKRDVSESNISYLVQYGKVRKHNGGSAVLVDVDDLKHYYDSYHGQREVSWKERLGDDLNWSLSFDHLREKDTTKHVHRLHPYKGKFIPQLVEYFLDDHTDRYKKNVYFHKGDIVLDPFAGSGTALVQANELGIHAIGVDISSFNCLISDVKLGQYNLDALEKEVKRIKQAIAEYETDSSTTAFDQELTTRLASFNNKNFPSPQFKYDVQRGKIREFTFATEKEFLSAYNRLVKKHGITLRQSLDKMFIDKWYIKGVRKEIDFAAGLIEKIKDEQIRNVLTIILSRTVRSCRATTHSDLATLKEPQVTTYYCFKHKKVCKPLFSIKAWFERYAFDTVERLRTYAELRSSAEYAAISADSRNVDIVKEVRKQNENLYKHLAKKKIQGIFSSPPYVGQIDYHEQHAYAYNLFHFERKDELEIGPLYKGQGLEARASYVQGITGVLLNCKKFLAENAEVFLVANDKYNLYPTIAEKSGMKIVNQFKRPVLNRTERDKSPYSEIIFHLKVVL